MHPPCRAAILAVYAAESLLLAFALKLRVGAALAGHRGGKGSVPAGCAAMGLDDATFHRAASFLGQCMPTYVQQPGAGRPALKVRSGRRDAGAAAALDVPVASRMHGSAWGVAGNGW